MRPSSGFFALQALVIGFDKGFDLIGDGQQA
jgi:hypothetical protein